MGLVFGGAASAASGGGLDFGGGASGATSGGLSFAPPQLASSGGGGGLWGGAWNPLNYAHQAYDAINPVGGMQQLASGIGNMFVRPVYGVAEGAGQVLGGGIEQAMGNQAAAQQAYGQARGTILDAARSAGSDIAGLGTMALGLPQDVLSLGGTADNPLSNLYKQSAGQLVQSVAPASAPYVNSDTAASLAHYQPQGFLQDAQKEGILAAGVSHLAPFQAAASGALRLMGPADSAAAIASTEAGSPAAGAGDLAGMARSEAGALDTAAPVTTSGLRTGLQAVAHPYGTFGRATADIIKANWDAAHPAAPSIPSAEPVAGASTPGTGFTPEQMTSAASDALAGHAATAADAALNPTRDVLGQASAAADASASPVTLPGDAATVAHARAMMDPAAAAADAMAGNHVAATGPQDELALEEAARPSGSAATPPGTDRAQALDKAVQDARAVGDAQGPVKLLDKMGNRASAPAPAWAQRLADLMPPSVNRIIGHLNTPMTKMSMQTVGRNLTRYLEVAQQTARDSPMVRSVNDAATALMRAKSGLNDEAISKALGEEIASRVDGSQLAAEYVHTTGQGASPQVLADLVNRTKGNYPGITPETMALFTPEEQGAIKAGLDQAAEAYKAIDHEATQTMLASRYGATGLEAAILPDETPMTRDVSALYQRAMADYRRAAVLRGNIPAEQAAREASLARSEVGTARATADVARLQDKLGITESTITSLHDGIPPGLKDAAGTTQKILLAVEGDGGGTFDIATGATPITTPGIHVGIANQFDVTEAEFAANGAQLVQDAITKPVDSNGARYDPAALWGGPDAHLGIWKHDGPVDPRTGLAPKMVSSEVSINSNGGPARPLDEVQATILGEAFKQDALFDPAANGGQGGDIFLSKDPNIQNLAANYAGDVLDPKSGFTRVWNAMIDTVGQGALPITPKDISAQLLSMMQLDQALHQLEPKLWPHGNLFDKTDVSGTMAQNADLIGTHLEQRAQTLGMVKLDGYDKPMPVVTGPAHDFQVVGQTVDDNGSRYFIAQRSSGSFVAIRDATAETGRLLAHHDIGQSEITAVERNAAAGGSVDAKSMRPLQDFFEEQGKTPKSYKPFLRDFQKQISAGNFDGARRALTSYTTKLRNDVVYSNDLYQRVDGVLRGTTMVDPGPAGRYMIRLYQTADLGTLVHENAHLMRQILTPDIMREVSRLYPGIEGRMPSGNLNVQRVAAEENFVTDLTRYMQDSVAGRTVPPGHELIFNRIASVLEDTHASFLDTPTGRTLPNDITAFWDRLFHPTIVKPDVVSDPLSKQGAQPTASTNVDTKQFRWESDAAYAERVRQYGEARMNGAQQRIQVQQAQAREVKATAATAAMRDVINNMPTRSATLADKLTTAAGKLTGRAADLAGNAVGNDVPVDWRPIMGYFNDLAEAAKADKTGGMAEVLGEIPTTMKAVMDYAAQHDFQPTHIIDMTSTQAQRFLFGHMSLLDDTADKSFVRARNTGVLARQGLAYRSMETLSTGLVVATKELFRGKLVDYIEQNYAHMVKASDPTPDGYQDWSPQKQAIITGKNVITGEVTATADRLVVPDAVGKALDDMRKPYVQWNSKLITKSTQAWKTMLLTTSPSWYLKHFIGATSLATLEGVTPSDWLTAFRQWRNNDLPDVVRGRSIYSTDIANEDRAGSVLTRPKQLQLADVARREGLAVAQRTFVGNLKNIVKSWDGMSRAAVYAHTLRLNPGDLELATSRSYEALGDFGNLGPIERMITQQVMPFYAFQKAMFKIMTHLPADHPLATGIMMQLGRMNQAQLQADLLPGGLGVLPSNLIGAGISNNQLVGYQKLNPLTDAWTLATAPGIVAALNPFLTMLLQQGHDAPVFGGPAGMGSYGQLTANPNIVSQLWEMFKGAGIGNVISDPTNPATLAQWFGQPKVYTPAQVDALMKRIAKTQKGITTVANGGYLAPQSATAPAANPVPVAPTPAQALG